MANDFTVRSVESKGHRYWRTRISNRLTGKGKAVKRDFSTEEQAAKWGEEEATRLREFGRRTLEIPPRVQDYLQRFALNALFEKNLDEHQIRRLLEEALHRFKPAQDQEPLWSFYPEFRHRRNWSEETLARGAARVYENELKPFLQNERLGSFTNLESGLRLATKELDDWAARYAAKTGEPPAHRTFLNHRNALGTFFRHLAKRDLVPHSLPVQIREIASKDLRSTIKKETGESIHVLPPHLIELILQTAPKFHLAHFVILKALCGMRDKEAANLTWDCLKEDHVFVPAEVSKIGKSRRISFEDVPSLGKWLAFADSHGRPRRKTIGGARARREGHWQGLVETLREQLGLGAGETWGDKYPNALRDSFCSYGCLVLDYTKVQMICGHHVGSHTTFRRYISSNVTKADAVAFFALQPSSLVHP